MRTGDDAPTASQVRETTQQVARGRQSLGEGPPPGTQRRGNGTPKEPATQDRKLRPGASENWRAAAQPRTRSDPRVAVWPRLAELLGKRRARLGRAKDAGWEWPREGENHPGANWAGRRTRRTAGSGCAPVGVPKRSGQKGSLFARAHEPGAGNGGRRDFTHMEVAGGVTIQGQPFAHMVYHFRLDVLELEDVRPACA